LFLQEAPQWYHPKIHFFQVIEYLNLTTMGVLIPSLKNNSISTDDHLEKLGMGPELLTPLRDERDQNGGFVQHVVPICPCLIPG
jgi:hypothetical protein